MKKVSTVAAMQSRNFSQPKLTIRLGPGDAPLVLRNTGNQQIYAFDWDAP